MPAPISAATTLTERASQTIVATQSTIIGSKTAKRMGLIKEGMVARVIATTTVIQNEMSVRKAIGTVPS